MIPNLWSGLSGKLADRWMEWLFSPALVFWAVGAWLGLSPAQWAALEKTLNSSSTPRQILLVAAALLLVMASAALARHLRFPTLRFLEGYWPKALEGLRGWLLKRAARRMDKQQADFQKLAGKGLDNLNTKELAEYLRLDAALMQAPADARYLMPTHLGNVLRAAELAPRDRYGLDGVILWPRLWLLLPEATRTELGEAREQLDAATERWLWSLLLLAWTPWAWWLPALCLVLALYAYRQALRAAEVYAALIVAACDLNRTALYQALRWPQPSNPAEEHKTGEKLTEYLWRGSDRDQPAFVDKEAKPRPQRFRIPRGLS